MKEFEVMTLYLRTIVTAVTLAAFLSGCSLFRNPESEAEREAPRLLDNSKAENTWYCYGRDEDAWECVQEKNPDLVRKIEPAPAVSERPAPSMPVPARETVPLEPPEPPPATVDDPLLTQPEDHFAVQLIALQSEEDVLTYARSNGISEPMYTEIENDGTRWYVLLLGVYPDQQTAASARDEWARTKSLKAQPWIRRLGPLQDAIRTARAGT